MSHYETLGVETHASPDEIKKAYRAKARQSHPDLGGDKESFSRVLAAYNVLSDPGKRERYDNTGDDSERRMPGAQEILSAMIMEAMASEGDPIEVIRRTLRSRLAESKKQVKECERLSSRIEKKIKSLLANNKPSAQREFFEEIMQQKLQCAFAGAAEGKRLIESLQAALEMIEGMQCPVDEERTLASFHTGWRVSF
jgi:curved DNA-binding protein CbpA